MKGASVIEPVAPFFHTTNGGIMIDWNQIIGKCLTQVLCILLPLAIALIIKWAVELYHRIRQDHAEWAPMLEYAAETAVLAAEQLFGTGQGKEKKQYAIETIRRILAENGIELDVAVISDAIEAEVYKWLPHETAEHAAAEGPEA